MKTNLNLNLLAVLAAGLTAFASCSKSDPSVIEPPVTPGDSNESLADAFFEKVAYKGAFGSTDWTSGWVNYEPNKTAYSAATEEISGEITADKTLDASKNILVKRFCLH